jgi:hypothetical protein
MGQNTLIEKKLKNEAFSKVEVRICRRCHSEIVPRIMQSLRIRLLQISKHIHQKKEKKIIASNRWCIEGI